MARAPSRPGKTRLTGGLPPERAEALRHALLADVLAVIGGVGVPCTVFVTPDDALAEAGLLLPRRFSVAPQGGGDLGQRMLAAFDALFAAGATAAVLVGSDSPTLPPDRLTDAFGALESGRDLVLGPADDGGYYLVGLTRREPAIFEGIAWGGAEVLPQTEQAARRIGLEPFRLAPWYDVDTPEDLARAVESGAPATHLRAWVKGTGGTG